MTNTKDTKQLLIESCEFVSKIKLSKDLKESVKMSSGKSGTLIVRNVPCTILNRKNQNGRIYSTEVLQEAIEAARMNFQTKSLLSQADEHPESSYVAPSHASHVIIDAYVKKNVSLVVEGKRGKFDVLFMDWEVLNTVEGKNLRALFEAECSIGTSIRGVGDLNGDMVENYEIFGCDCVGNPSSSTFTRMPISESVKIEVQNKDQLSEGFVVTTTSTDVASDLENAARIQIAMEDAQYGTVVKIGTKVDQENDPKTGAQTKITTVEGETSDEVDTLDSALMMAKRAFLNGQTHVDTVTIENIKSEETTHKESVGNDDAQGELDTEADENVEMEEGLGGAILGGLAGTLVGHPILGAVGGHAAQEYMRSSKKNKKKTANKVKKAAGDTIEGLGSVAKGVGSATKGVGNVLGATGNLIGKGINKLANKISEAKEEDPNDGRQYVLKVNNLDPEMKEGSNDEPEFVCMKGNAIRFTKDPKQALHFTQGMEESGIIHFSGVKKLLGDMGYGEKDLEKWYKRDEESEEQEEIEEGLIGGAIGGTAGALVGGNVAGPLGVLGGAASGYSLGSNIGDDVSEMSEDKEPIQEENGSNTRYMAEIHIDKEGGASETDTIPVSATDMDSVLAEVANLWAMKVKKGDGKVTVYVIDSVDGSKYLYDNDQNSFQPAQTPQTEAVDDSVVQDNNKLTVSLGGDYEVTKEFDDVAQASVARSALEQGKIDGSVMLTDATEDNDWKAWVLFDQVDFGNGERLYNNGDPASGQYIFDRAPGDKPKKILVTVHPEELQNNDGLDVEEIKALASKKLENSLGGFGHFYNLNLVNRNRKFEKSGIYGDDVEELIESIQDDEDVTPGWYVIAKAGVGVVGPYSSREEAIKDFEDFEDMIKVWHITEKDIENYENKNKQNKDEKLGEELFSNPSAPSDNFIQEPLQDDVETTKFVVKNIDWDEEDIWRDWEGNDLETETLQKAIRELPDSIEIEVSEEDIKGIASKDELLSILRKKAEEKSNLKIKNAEFEHIG